VERSRCTSTGTRRRPQDGFDDYMSKEMHEQSKAVADTLLDRLLPDGTLVLDEVRITNESSGRSPRSSSWLRQQLPRRPHGQVRHRTLGALPVEIDISSEFRYRNPW